jgi:Co/Zn/Cd efflux system component
MAAVMVVRWLSRLPLPKENDDDRREAAADPGRAGDANMQSVWIRSRNDVLGNFAVLLAALGVFGTGTGWPDLIAAAIMATLAMQGAWIVARQASGELQSPAAQPGYFFLTIRSFGFFSPTLA